MHAQTVGPVFNRTAIIPVALALILFAMTSHVYCRQGGPLTDLGQVRSLGPQEADSRLPVRLTAVVSYYDPVKSHLFVEDSHAGAYVYFKQKATGLRCGEVLHIEAKTAAGDFNPVLVEAEVSRIPGPVELPPPPLATVTELLTGRWDCRRVLLDGEVRSATRVNHEIQIRLLSGGRNVTVHFLEPPDNLARYEGLIESHIRVRAVCGITADTKRRPREFELYSCNWSDLVILNPSPPNPFARPVITAARLTSLPLVQTTNRVHIRGVVEQHVGEGLVVRDPTGTVRVEGKHGQISLGETVEALGFPTLRDETMVIEDALIRTVTGPVPSMTLAKVADIRALSALEASRARPVGLRGVVTYCDGDQLFIEDETGGMFIRAKPEQLTGVRHGQLVDIDGYTDPGGFAPIAVATQPVRVIGKGNLRGAQDWTVESLLRGNVDSQWIDASGVVLSQVSYPRHLELLVATRARIRLSVKILHNANHVPAQDLTDAEVVASGVCATLDNSNRQLTGVELLVPDFSKVVVKRRPPKDPFGIELQSIASLRGFSPNPRFGHRVHVRGTVTATRPPFAFIADSSGPLLLSTTKPTSVNVGDEIDVAGFPGPSSFAPILQYALIRKTGLSSPPHAEPHAPFNTSASGEHDGELMTLEARLIDVLHEDREAVLVLGSTHQVFHASLPYSDGALPKLRVGSSLRLTGVCSVRLDELRQVKTFRLLLRSPQDVTILSQPPWWTLGRILGVTSAMALLLALFIGWTVTLKRKVSVQTQLIRRRLEAEAALEKGYRDLLDNAEELIQNVSLDGNFLYVNPAWCRRLCFGTTEAGHLHYLDIVAPAERDAFARQFEAAKAGNPPDRLETVLVSALGEPVSVIGSLAYQVSERGASVQAIFHDITERKKAEQALRQSEERFAKAFRASPVAMAIVSNSRLIDANDSLLSILAGERDEVIGRTPQELGIEVLPGVRRSALQALAQGESVSGLEMHLRDRAGILHTVVASAESIIIAEERCILAILDDVTEKQRLENELRQAQKMEAVGQLAAGIAHDFNNLLTIIRSNTSLLLSEEMVAPEQRRSLQQISHATTRAATLTRQMLMFGRKQPLKAAPLDVNKLIAESIPQFKSIVGPAVDIHFEPAPKLPILKADAAMLGQCLLNLVSNARDAMPGGGALGICTQSIEIDPAETRTRPELAAGSYLRLTVSDSGVGIDPAVLDRIFDPFYTTKEFGKGAGLGLALVYGIVQQHRGWIDLTSTPGRGSSFRLHFPLAESSEACPPAKCATEPGTGDEAGTLLVVEDEELIASLAKRTLENRGYTVLVAASGHDALGIWQEQNDKIALVMTDLAMPGMNGHDLLRKLRAERNDLKAIVCSGRENQIPEEMCDDNVMFLPKPYDCPALVSAVQECLGSGEAAPQK